MVCCAQRPVKAMYLLYIHFYTWLEKNIL